ncbi:MAG: hypothetical protein HWN79_17225 [Candidatus Lokiarchaeota archaeon]|nr:hypothetical protein [Candidatus Lokiarchaeota archaeon]
MTEEEIILNLLLQIDKIPSPRILDFVEELISQLNFIYLEEDWSSDSDVFTESEEEDLTDEQIEDLRNLDVYYWSNNINLNIDN